MFAQLDTQRRRRNRGGKSAGKSAMREAANDTANKMATSAKKKINAKVEDSLWCAIGDPFNIVGCDESFSWFAQTDDFFDDMGVHDFK